MRSEAVKTALELLNKNPQVSDYKINVTKKESFELFYVKGKLETVRSTDTCDRTVTVYADHDGCRGDAVFSIYPSTDRDGLKQKIAEAVHNALLISNAPYSLPGNQEEENILHSNLSETPMPQLAEQIARLVFSANTQEGGSLNSVEIFLNRYEESICNSRGLKKAQQRYSAMVEAIPTFNGDKESVELYEQYNFSAFDPEALLNEIGDKMTAVKARYEAWKPEFPLNGKIIFHKQELFDLFSAITEDLNYATVYSHGNTLKKGQILQSGVHGDPMTLTMKGFVEGNASSSSFDSDGLSLRECTLIADGKVENFYGSNRFGQYLGETPTGNLGCITVAPGSLTGNPQEPYLEVLAMSGLQVDFFNDYIGGEIRLACYHDGENVLPVTGISVSGKLMEVLDHMKFSSETAIHDSYFGPARAMADNMRIF